MTAKHVRKTRDPIRQLEANAKNVMGYARDQQKLGKRAVSEHYRTELAMAKALVAALTYMGMALWGNRGQQRMFPADWLRADGQQNADILLGLTFCQLANYAYSAVDLVEKGLDAPARAVVRSAAELSSMIVVLVGNREAFQVYARDDASLDDKQKWYELFSDRKMAAQLAHIETRLGLPANWVEFMRGFRRENSEFLSEAVHHSFRSIVAGLMPTVRDTDGVDLALLGGPNGKSGHTLGHLVTCIMVCLQSTFATVAKVYGFPPAVEKWDFFSAGLDIFSEVEPVFSEWLKEAETDPKRMVAPLNF